MKIESQLRGYLWGSACGDALGRPVEFLDLDEINSRYGPEGITELPEIAGWTDDTQMMLAIARALINGSDLPIEGIMKNVTDEYIRWVNNPGYAPGTTCMRGVSNLSKGVHWTKSGIMDSKGCGSVMRSGVIGFIYQNNIKMLVEVASATGIATHGHPTADAACIAGALSVKFALDGLEPSQIVDKTQKEVLGVSQEFDDKLTQAKELAISDTPIGQAMIRLGEGWTGHEAFAMACLSMLRYPNDYLSSVRAAVNITGDSDSIGCIVGGILGAKMGISTIPERWPQRLKNNQILEEMVRPLLLSKI